MNVKEYNKIDVEDDFYKLLHPKLSLLIVSTDENGKPNVMTCSWSMPVSEVPPLIALAISRKAYTNELIRKTKEFTVNVPDMSMIKEIWTAGTRSGKRVNKIELLKLKLAKARRVKAPIIENCIAHLECKLVNAVEAGEITIFLGQVVAAYADKDSFKKGIWDIDKVELPLHLGSKYFTAPRNIKSTR